VIKSIVYFLLIFVLSCSSRCEKEDDKYYITIKNNSSKEIIYVWSSYFSAIEDTSCLKIIMESDKFIRDSKIEPYSSIKKGIDDSVEGMQTYPNTYLFIGIFYREDIDKMSCEEFTSIYPLKKEWKVTLEDLEAANFNLVLEYTP
jgi:hypothetical protein